MMDSSYTASRRRRTFNAQKAARRSLVELYRHTVRFVRTLPNAILAPLLHDQNKRLMWQKRDREEYEGRYFSGAGRPPKLLAASSNPFSSVYTGIVGPT